MWDSVQGVTQLTTPFRCKDAWWNSVLNEIRVLQLSDDNYAFIHGTETTVPGSWLDDKPLCENENCALLKEKWQSLQKEGASWETRRRMECSKCSTERSSRQRVLREDAKLDGEEFESIPCAVPNNDMRYEINKLRSRLFTKARNLQLLWSPAKDWVTFLAL